MPDALEIELNDEFNVVLDEGMAGKVRDVASSGLDTYRLHDLRVCAENPLGWQAEPVCTDPLPGVPLKLIGACK